MAYTREQRRIIQLGLGLSRGYSPRVREALLEAMAVESTFRNLNYGDRDSRGVLQQRPSTGWGPPGNAAVDIRQFLQRAGQLDRSFRGTPGQLAQAIQRSAFPGRYDQHAREAESLLGGAAGSSVGAGSVLAGPSVPAASGGREAVIQALLRASQETGRHQEPNYGPLFTALRGLKQPTPQDVKGPSGLGQGPPHGNSLNFLEPFGRRFGLTITSTTGGKHVPGSYHYEGRAVDYGGSPQRMMALMQYALHHPNMFTEAFYDPAGFYVKNGHVYRGSIGGHRDHVHLAR